MRTKSPGLVTVVILIRRARPHDGFLPLSTDRVGRRSPDNVALTLTTVMAIRRATPQDVPQLAALARDAYAPYVERIGRPPAPMVADYLDMVVSHETWVSEDETGITGLVVLVPNDDHLLLENIAVRPDQQGQGIGSTLLAIADRRARDLGLSEVRLYTNEKMTENLTYYPRHGYVRTHSAAEDGFRRVYFTRYL
jgi:N-acetylglutamate synthase-like GNAT family acetyltransferase